jgi:hypothetical protein
MNYNQKITSQTFALLRNALALDFLIFELSLNFYKCKAFRFVMEVSRLLSMRFAFFAFFDSKFQN